MSVKLILETIVRANTTDPRIAISELRITDPELFRSIKADPDIKPYLSQMPLDLRALWIEGVRVVLVHEASHGRNRDHRSRTEP